MSRAGWPVVPMAIRAALVAAYVSFGAVWGRIVLADAAAHRQGSKLH